MTDPAPGIRRTVAFLRAWLFETIVSGDSQGRIDMHVHPSVMEAETVRLRDIMQSIGVNVRPIDFSASPTIRVTFDPVTGLAVLSLRGVDDAQIPATLAPCRSISSKQARAPAATSSSSTTSRSPTASPPAFGSPRPKPRS